MSGSELIEAPQLANDGLPVLRAYGDSDDPMRLMVLLAEALRSVVGDALVQKCQSPRTSWTDRSRALRDLLRRGKTTSGGVTKPRLVLVDLDALFPRGTSDWDEQPSHRIRQHFFDIVRDDIVDGGWRVLRPWPSAAVSEALLDGDPSLAAGPPSKGDIPAFFAPDCRSVVRWLLDRKTLRESEAMRIVRTVPDPNEHIMRVAYDVLNAAAREALRSLAAVRAPSHANGQFGNLKWATTEKTGPLRLTRAAFNELRLAGLVQSDLEGGQEFRLPRRVRSMVSVYANATDGERTRLVHEQLARGVNFEAASFEEKLEVHYHAVRALDIDLAKKTALYYGTELRHVATTLSRREKWKEAAELFEYIVERFDPNDAYALEYMAFNYALLDKKDKASGRHEEKIRAAYGKARENAKWNPLYHGRWLGYRAERGDAVASEIEHALASYLEQADASEDRVDWVSRFAESALDGLKRGKQKSARDEIVKRWRSRLAEYAPRVLAKHDKTAG